MVGWFEQPRSGHTETVSRPWAGHRLGRWTPFAELKETAMTKTLLVILCLFLPFLAVLIKDGPSLKVLWAFLLQLLGHIPGVVYGIYQVVRD
jgi:uncharacterized membrane protein YqaE (UPF0057 family)